MQFEGFRYINSSIIFPRKVGTEQQKIMARNILTFVVCYNAIGSSQTFGTLFRIVH